MKRTARTALAALAVSLMLGACASTSLQNAWKDPQYSSAPFRKVLVVGITKEATNQRTFEDIFSAQLRARGVEAIAAYTVLGKAGPADEEALKAAVKKSGAEGVITTRVVSIDTQKYTTPGTVTYHGAPVYPRAYHPVPPPGVSFYGYYQTTTAVYHPPQEVTYVEATLETSVFEARTGKLVWVGTTVSFDPRAVAATSAELAKVVIEALAKERII